MITAIFALIASLLFLAGFFNLIKLPNSPTKLLLLFKFPFYPSPTHISNHDSSSSSKVTPMSTTMEDGRLKQVFDTFDKNGDGFITRQELKESLKNIGIVIPTEDVEDMVNTLDSNKDGLIDLDEFKKLFEMVNSLDSNIDGVNKSIDDDDDEGDLKEAFDVFDGDKDGLITVQELGLVLSSLGLKEGKREEDCKEMIRKVDVDGDGMVNFNEFKKMMRGGFGVSSLVTAF